MFILILNVLLAMIVEFKIRYDSSSYSTQVIHNLIYIIIIHVFNMPILYYFMKLLLEKDKFNLMAAF